MTKWGNDTKLSASQFKGILTSLTMGVIDRLAYRKACNSPCKKQYHYSAKANVLFEISMSVILIGIFIYAAFFSETTTAVLILFSIVIIYLIIYIITSFSRLKTQITITPKLIEILGAWEVEKKHGNIDINSPKSKCNRHILLNWKNIDNICFEGSNIILQTYDHRKVYYAVDFGDLDIIARWRVFAYWKKYSGQYKAKR